MTHTLGYTLQIEAAKKAKTSEKPEEAAAGAQFHGKDATDWQGRSWMAPPKDQRKELTDKCFLPKRWIHTWSGHTKGVNAIRFFPTTGNDPPLSLSTNTAAVRDTSLCGTCDKNNQHEFSDFF